MGTLKDRLFVGAFWSAIERISVQGFQFVLGIILARILSPDEYGTMGLLLVGVVICQVFVDSGFSKALIQKKNRTETDVSTVFFFNLAISLLCYAVLWLLAPTISTYYANEELIPLIRVIAFTLIFNALFTIPTTLFTINLNFKAIARANLISVIISGIIAIVLALSGFGVWALVYQVILRVFISAVIMWFQGKWVPKPVFSLSSFKSMFSFGSNLLIVSLMNTTINNLAAIFIAKYVTIKDLGFYTRGTQFADVVFGVFSSVIDSVLLPGLSGIQDDRDRLRAVTKSIIRSTAIFSVPVLLGLAVLAEPIIITLLTEKWRMAIPIMQILCVTRLITIISGINVNILYVLGRADLALRQQYVKIIVRAVLLIASLRHGIVFIALAELISTTIHFFINTYYPSKIMNYGSGQQILDILPVIVASFLSLSLIIGCFQFTDSNILKLFIAPILGFPLYIGFLKLARFPEVTFLYNKARTFLPK